MLFILLHSSYKAFFKKFIQPMGFQKISLIKCFAYCVAGLTSPISTQLKNFPKIDSYCHFVGSALLFLK